MAAAAEEETSESLLRTYLGISFAAFLALLPDLVPSRSLRSRLRSAEAELLELRSRRKEDAKANARVVEIFAGHRHAWRQEEKRLLAQIERTEAELRETVEEMRREIRERDEMIGFMAERRDEEDEEREGEEEECFWERERGRESNVEEEEEEINEGLFGSKFWGERERPSLWQDVHYESVEPLYHLKQFVSRREYPWKTDGETAGVSSKLKLLEQEVLNLERIGQSNLSKIPSLMKKQAKRYQALAGKIDDLCRRMQASDPYEATMSSEFRTQRHTEFLLEAVRLQHRATETAQKLTALQTETGKSYFENEVESQVKLTTKRCLDSIKNNLKEIQRNFEIWLARIIGDLEGILARDSVSRVRDHYMSRYP